jgi:hypothetical protein
VSREVRLVLAAGSVVLLLAIAAAVLMLNPATPAEPGVSLKAVEPVDVVRLAIRNAHSPFEIDFTGEGYQVDDIPAELVDIAALIRLLTNAGNVYAQRSVVSDPRSLES